jgi:hypothetical protein
VSLVVDLDDLAGCPGLDAVRNELATLGRMTGPVLMRTEAPMARLLVSLLAPGFPVAEVSCALVRGESAGLREVLARNRVQLGRPGILLLLDVDQLSSSDRVFLATISRTGSLDVRGTPTNRRVVMHMESHGEPFQPSWFSEVVVPPWSARVDDTVSLIRRLLVRHVRSDLALDDEAIGALRAHAWTGGLSELLLRVERVAVARNADGAASVSFDALGLPRPASQRLRQKAAAQPAQSLKAIMDEYEAEVLRAVLTRHGNNKSRAARELDISRSYLIQKCQHHGIDDERVTLRAQPAARVARLARESKRRGKNER